MVRNSLILGRIAGIEIGVHHTWLWVAALVTWSLAQGNFPAAYPGWAPSNYWLAGTVAAVAFFACVLAHELGHSLVAVARGIPVLGITLFVFGGVARIKEEADTPRDEFLIAVAGPLTSFGLAAAFWGAGRALAAAGDTASPAAAVAAYLALTNALLGLFNLLPGFPLDGGRVLRAAVWAGTGSLRRATEVASTVGQVIGYLLVAWGVVTALGGGVLSGVWTALIGWFLGNAAGGARQAQELKDRLRGVRVAELMEPRPATAPPDMSVHEFVTEHVLRRGKRALPVMAAGRVLGLVSVTDAKKVPPEAWENTPVERIMTPAPLHTVAPGSGVDAALRLLAEHALNQVPVVERGELAGMLSRADILRYLEYHRLLVPLPDGTRARAAQAEAASGVDA
jgi:Zn-dependent protease/predicted transcriptional regulator